jgi:hypothetical protein
MISLMHGPPLGTGARAASAHVGAFTTLFTKYLVVCPSKLELPASYLPSYVSIPRYSPNRNHPTLQKHESRFDEWAMDHFTICIGGPVGKRFGHKYGSEGVPWSSIFRCFECYIEKCVAATDM